MAERTRTFSARWRADVLDRLRRRSEAAGTNKSRLAERYVDEGIRMDEHPGIVFRGGPSGRRAALAGGPDVWEVIATLKGCEARGEGAITEAAELLNLPASQARTALAYYGSYPEEVDERIRRTLEEADAAEAARHRRQAAVA